MRGDLGKQMLADIERMFTVRIILPREANVFISIAIRWLSRTPACDDNENIKRARGKINGLLNYATKTASKLAEKTNSNKSQGGWVRKRHMDNRR